MTKTFNFTSKKNNNKFFLNNDYSTTLDNIILADIAKKNDYLFEKKYDGNLFTSLIGKSPIIITGGALKGDDDFTKATKFLANYKTIKANNLPYIYGKMYTLSDGTPIVFYKDEIQIGFDLYTYDDFNDFSFLKNISAPLKKIIINIYNTGNAKININLL